MRIHCRPARPDEARTGRAGPAGGCRSCRRHRSSCADPPSRRRRPRTRAPRRGPRAPRRAPRCRRRAGAADLLGEAHPLGLTPGGCDTSTVVPARAGGCSTMRPVRFVSQPRGRRPRTRRRARAPPPAPRTWAARSHPKPWPCSSSPRPAPLLVHGHDAPRRRVPIAVARDPADAPKHRSTVVAEVGELGAAELERQGPLRHAVEALSHAEWALIASSCPRRRRTRRRRERRLVAREEHHDPRDVVGGSGASHRDAAHDRCPGDGVVGDRGDERRLGVRGLHRVDPDAVRCIRGGDGAPESWIPAFDEL